MNWKHTLDNFFYYNDISQKVNFMSGSKFIIMFIIGILLIAIISYLWVNEIDKMSKEHPDYKGEDFP